MILENELKDKLKEASINCFSVMVKDEEKLNLNLQSNNLDELIEFAKVNDIKTIFYAYSFFDKKEFIIDEEDVFMLDKDVYKQIKSDIKKHNEKVNKLDFTKPASVDIFCIYEGGCVSICEFDLWIEDLNIISGEDRLDELVEECRDIIEKKKEEKEKETESLRQEFRDYIINDDKFKICTNQNLRKEYMRTVFYNEEAKKYKKLFVRGGAFGNDMVDVGRFFDFIEMIWREQKNQVKARIRDMV